MLKQVLAMAALIGVTGTGVAAEDAFGEQEFMVACAGCHGESAKGNGPLASMLKIETPDLTRMSANNGGEFPYEYALWVIDGRQLIRIHGDADMPVWGDRYMSAIETTATAGGSPETWELAVRGRILSLIYHLESIQE